MHQHDYDHRDYRTRGLSASTRGRGIKIEATTSPGTFLHQALNSSAANEWDRITLQAVNSSASPVTLTIEWGGPTNGLVVGQTNAGVAATHDEILNLQVSPGTAYRFSVQVRGLSTYSGVNFRLRIKDQAGTTLVTSSAFVLTADWQVQAVALTTGGSAHHLVVEIVKDTNAADVIFQAAGFLLVQGMVLPGHNEVQVTSGYDNVTERVMNIVSGVRPRAAGGQTGAAASCEPAIL